MSNSNNSKSKNIINTNAVKPRFTQNDLYNYKV